MSANYNSYNNMTNKWFELATDAYRTYVKSLVWGQERALEATRTVLARTDKVQTEGQDLVQEYTEELRRTRTLLQEMWRDSVKATSDAVRQYRETTSENLEAVNERLDEIQSRVEANAKSPIITVAEAAAEMN